MKERETSRTSKAIRSKINSSERGGYYRNLTGTNNASKVPIVQKREVGYAAGF